MIQNQEPITLFNSEPEPDIAIIRGKLDDFSACHPGPSEVALVVEVSDTTLVTDRFKANLYAEAGIPVCWIIDLAGRAIEVMEKPAPTNGLLGYQEIRRFGYDDEVPIVIENATVAVLRVCDLLG